MLGSEGEVASSLEQGNGDGEALELAAELRKPAAWARVKAEELAAERLPLGREGQLPVGGRSRSGACVDGHGRRPVVGSAHSSPTSRSTATCRWYATRKFKRPLRPSGAKSVFSIVQVTWSPSTITSSSALTK